MHRLQYGAHVQIASKGDAILPVRPKEWDIGCLILVHLWLLYWDRQE